MTHVTCRLAAKIWDQLRNPTLGNRVWATFFRFRGQMPPPGEGKCRRLCEVTPCCCRAAVGRYSVLNSPVAVSTRRRLARRRTKRHIVRRRRRRSACLPARPREYHACRINASSTASALLPFSAANNTAHAQSHAETPYKPRSPAPLPPMSL